MEQEAKEAAARGDWQAVEKYLTYQRRWGRSDQSIHMEHCGFYLVRMTRDLVVLAVDEEHAVALAEEQRCQIEQTDGYTSIEAAEMTELGEWADYACYGHWTSGETCRELVEQGYVRATAVKALG